MADDVKRKREDSEGMTLIDFLLLFIRQFGLYRRLNSNLRMLVDRCIIYLKNG